jgi:PAS domain S-box-containing protein
MAFITDADGTTLYSNLHYQTYTGLPAEALMGNAWATLIHPEDCEQAAASWISALVLGAAVEVEYRLRRADGAARWFRRRAAPQLDEKGQICYWFGTLEDIHEEHEAEDAAPAAEGVPWEHQTWPRLAHQPSGAGFFEWDPITEELRWSSRCKAVFGLPPEEEPTDEVFQSRLHPEDRPAVLERIERALDPAGPGKYRSQHRVVWPDGTVRWMRANGAVTFENVAGLRRAVHFSGVALDVTVAKLTEGAPADRRRTRNRRP